MTKNQQYMKKVLDALGVKDPMTLFTDDRAEAVRIGEAILQALPEVYNESTVQSFYDVINKVMPQGSAEEKREAFAHATYDYWMYGVNVKEEFFYGFDHKTHQEKSEYITFRSRYVYLYQISREEDAHKLVDKYETYCDLKPYFMREAMEIRDETDFDAFCAFVERHPTFVVKPMDLAFALGVHKETVEEGQDKKEVFDRLLREAAGTKEQYKWGKRKALLLEELIPQAESMAILHPYSVNSVRMVTVRTGDEVAIFYPWIKIGMNKDFACSAAQGSLMAGIDPVTGVINTPGYTEFCEKFDVHPMTKINILGFQIPRWEELVAVAKEVALQYDTIRYVGWDFVLTDNGWCVLEGNFGAEFVQQTYLGKGFKEEFEELIQWKPDTPFWWEA